MAVAILRTREGPLAGLPLISKSNLERVFAPVFLALLVLLGAGCGGGGGSKPQSQGSLGKTPTPINQANNAVQTTLAVELDPVGGFKRVVGERLVQNLTADQRQGLAAIGIKIEEVEGLVKLVLPSSVTDSQLGKIMGSDPVFANPVLSPGSAPDQSPAKTQLLATISPVLKPGPQSARVAVLDTGVLAAHFPQGRLVPQVDFIKDGQTGDPNGHGTQVADQVLGSSLEENWCGNCQVQSLRVCSGSGHCPVFSVLSALDYLKIDPPSVVLISLGAKFQAPGYLSQAFIQAVQALKEKGSVVVVAAGNAGGDVSSFFPASLSDPLVVVGSSTSDGKSPSSFSNRGKVNLFAPGQDLPFRSGTQIEKQLTGTSFAAALVAGQIALGASWLGQGQKAATYIKGAAKSFGPDQFLLQGIDFSIIQPQSEGGQTSWAFLPGTAAVGDAVRLLPPTGMSVNGLTLTIEGQIITPTNGGFSFTAPTRSGTLPMKVQGQNAGQAVNQSLSYKVQPGPATSLTIAVSPEPLRAQREHRWLVAGLDAYGNTTGAPSDLIWEVAEGSLKKTGSLSFIPLTAGTLKVNFTRPGVQTSYQGTVTAEDPIEPKISPSGGRLQAGESLQLKVVGNLQNEDGTLATPIWEATTGAISEQGLFTATKTGHHQIKASVMGVEITAQVVVTPAPATSLSVLPSRASLMAGEPFSLAAKSVDAFGNVFSPFGVSWFSGNTTVELKNNLLTPKSVGTAKVLASLDGLQAQSDIEIGPGLPHGINLAQEINLVPGSPLPKTGAVMDSQGNALGDFPIAFEGQQILQIPSGQTVTVQEQFLSTTRFAAFNALAPLFGASGGPKELTDGNSQSTIKIKANEQKEFTWTLKEPTAIELLEIRGNAASPINFLSTRCLDKQIGYFENQAIVSKLVRVPSTSCSTLTVVVKGPAEISEFGAFSAAKTPTAIHDLARFEGNSAVLTATGKTTIKPQIRPLAQLKVQPSSLTLPPGGSGDFALMAQFEGDGPNQWTKVTPQSTTSTSPYFQINGTTVKGLSSGNGSATLTFGNKSVTLAVSISNGASTASWLEESGHKEALAQETEEVLLPAGNTGTWGFHRTSALMTGSVAQTILFLGKNGQLTSPSLSEKTKSALKEANNFWVSQAPAAAGLSFFPPTTNTIAFQNSVEESLIKYFQQQGHSIPAGLKADTQLSKASLLARAFANHQRSLAESHWSIVLVVLDEDLLEDGKKALAISTQINRGGQLQLDSGPMAWFSRSAIEDSAATHRIAHEIAHLFGALDEYASSGCTTAETGGYLKAANLGCNGTDSSLMRTGALALTSGTKAQIGWKLSEGGALTALQASRLEINPNWIDTSFQSTAKVSLRAINAWGDTIPGFQALVTLNQANFQSSVPTSSLDGIVEGIITTLAPSGSATFSVGLASTTLAFGPGAAPSTGGTPPKGLGLTEVPQGVLLTYFSPTCPDPNAPTYDCFSLSADHLGYQVLRSTTPEGPFQLIADSAPPGNFVDPTAQAGTTYWYKVSLVTQSGVSPATEARMITVTGEVGTQVQMAPPNIIGSAISNTTAASSLYLKNGDALTITLTVHGSEAASYTIADFSANLTAFGGGAGVLPDTYVIGTGVATWNLVASPITVHNSIHTATLTATNLSGSSNVSVSLTSDLNSPSYVSATTSTGGYVYVTFNEAIAASSLATTDFTVAGRTVTGISLQTTTMIRLAVSPVVPTDQTTSVTFVGAIADTRAGASGVPAGGTVAVADGQAPPAITAPGVEVNCYLFTSDITWVLPTGLSDLASTQIYRGTYPSGAYILRATVPTPAESTTETLPTGPGGWRYLFRLMDTSGNFTDTSLLAPSLAPCVEFSSDSTPGAFDQWGSVGLSTQFQDPFDIVVNTANQAFISDSGNHRIQKLDINGTSILNIGSSGLSDGRFRVPRGVAINTSNELVVADHMNNRVQVLNASTGAFIRKFSFTRPLWVAVDSGGTATFVTDGNDIHRYDATGTEVTTAPWPLTMNGVAKLEVSGTTLRVARPELSRVDLISTTTGATTSTVGGVIGSATGELINPNGFAFDTSGAVFIADTGNHRIHALSTSNIYFDLFGTFGYWDTDELNGPTSIGRFSTGRLGVVDRGNWRVNYIDPPPTVLCFGTC